VHRLFAPVLHEGGLRGWFPLLLWTLLVGAMLVIVFWFRTIGNMNVETDFYWTYVPVAKALLAGRLLLDNFRGPGYEIVLALFQLIVGDFFKAGMLLSVCSAGITLLLLYGVVKRAFDADTALLVAIGTAVIPAFFTFSYTAGTDMFFVVLAFSVLYLLIRSNLTHPWLLLLAGLLSGYTYLTRYNGLAIMLAAGASILWLCDPAVPWKKRIGSAFIFLTGAAVTIVPFSIYTHQVTGRFSYNDNFLNVAYEVYGRGRIRWDDYWQAIAPHFRSYADVMAYDPVKFFEHIGLNLFRHGWNDLTLLVPWPVGLGAVAGAIVMARSGLTRMQAVVLLFAALSYLILLPVFYTERFALLLLPFIVLLFARFLQWRGIKRIPGRWHRNAAWAVALGVAGWACVQSVESARYDIATEPVEILQVRDAFSGLTSDNPRGTSLSARKPHIAHYLDMEYVPFPYVSSEADLVTVLRQSKTDYVYISTYEVATRPELKDLLNSTSEHRGLRPLISVISPPSVLYRVVP